MCSANGVFGAAHAVVDAPRVAPAAKAHAGARKERTKERRNILPSNVQASWWRRGSDRCSHVHYGWCQDMSDELKAIIGPQRGRTKSIPVFETDAVRRASTTGLLRIHVDMHIACMY